MTEVKIDTYEFSFGNFVVRNVSDNLIFALFNSRNRLKGAYNMSSKMFLRDKGAVLENLSSFKLEYLAEGEDIIEEHIISALIIGGDYCRNREYSGKIVRVQQNLSDLAVEDFRKATGIIPSKYKPKSPDWIRAIKDVKIISIDQIVEKIKAIPRINTKKPDFNSLKEYQNYLADLLMKKQQPA